jgi:hypothetical protein
MNKYILQLQLLAGLGGMIATAMLVMLLRTSFRSGIDAMNGILIVFMASLATLSLVFAVRGQDPAIRVALRAASRGGVCLGGAGFVLGFVGPLVLNPESNCGPLLGIFFTGPLGFVVGTAVALAWHAHARARAGTEA